MPTMTTSRDLLERQVSLTLELIDDAPHAYPQIAEQVRQFAPTILTTALGVPVHPQRLAELAQARRERDDGEDGRAVEFWSGRYDELLSALIAPALAVSA